VVILLVVLLLFGPSRLPQAGAGLGKAIRGFKDALAGKDDKDEGEPPQQPELRGLPPASKVG